MIVPEADPGAAPKSGHASKDPFKAAFFESPQPMWFVDLPALSFLEVNDAAVVFYGYDREKFLQMGLADLLAEKADKPVELSPFREVKGVRGTVQQLHRRKDGRPVRVELSYYPVQFEARSAMHCAVRDATDQQKLIDALKESEERFRRIVEENNAAMLLFDARTYELLEANPSAATFYGYSRQQLLGKSILEIVARPRAAVKRQIRQVIASQHPRSKIHSQHITASGDVREVEVRLTKMNFGERTAIFSVVTDVTAESRAKKGLIESEARLRAIIDSIPFDIWLCDETGRYVLQNSLSLSLWGHSVGKMPDQTGLPQSMVDHFLDTNRRALSGETVIEEIIHVHDGEPRNYLSVLSPVFIDGRSIGFVGVNIDITERTHAEQQLKDSLQEKDALLREVHHRVKNNLQVISSLLQLQSLSVKDAEVKRALEDSRRRIHAMSLVHQKLYGSENLANIDFGEYLVSVTRQLAQAYENEGVSIDIAVEPITLEVGVAVPCGLILNELVNNALKHAFLPTGHGTVRVELSQIEDGKVRLSVADNGKGFPEDMDYRTAGSMGLALVRALTGQISGTLQLDRSEGTRFSVEFRP
ncbi:MAG TPA: PAS domain S-box protein [Spirochaetia bacterium]|nr:PAS domain S-box protein [Spirochaetia bacterium]